MDINSVLSKMVGYMDNATMKRNDNIKLDLDFCDDLMDILRYSKQLQKENKQLKADRLEMSELINNFRLNLLGDITDNDIKGDFDKGETLQNVLLTLNISTLKKAEQIIKESNK